MYIKLIEFSKRVGDNSRTTTYKRLQRWGLPFDVRENVCRRPVIYVDDQIIPTYIDMRTPPRSASAEPSETNREYHITRGGTNREWKGILLSNKYLRKPITPESRMARLYQIVERIRDKQECAA